MDHFCPWYVELFSLIVAKALGLELLTKGRVGGVVSENGFKFFVQFVSYTFVYCLFVLIVMAYYMSEQMNKPVSIDVLVYRLIPMS
jgi:hypothetical protein